MDDMQSPAVDNAVHPLYDEVLALSPARKYLGDILRYAERVDLALMTPQGSLSSTKYCLANPGSQYIIYQPDSGQFSVNLFAGTYNYEWFNPTTGAVKGSGTINAPNGNKNFIPPFNGDAVLYLSVSGTAVIPKLIPRDYWSVIYVTSEETDIREKKSAEKVFDGVIETRWAARWPPNRTVPPHPQEIVIDIGESYKISGFRYLPRQDFHDGAWQPSGTIADYKFYVSNNKDNWGAPVASGTFSKSGEEKQILFPEKEGRYFRLIALSEVNGNDGTVVSELNLIGTDADGCLTYEICNG
ncbi:MAG: discoidin domain-containing protein, partial [Planctomycetes bacterium]|nr:discoidin domain-containing protein [Planctomycetota bacterium]